MTTDTSIGQPATGGWREWTRHPFINTVVSARMHLVDSLFTYRMGIPASPLGRLLKYPAIAFERVSLRFGAATQDILFQRYYRLHGLHYGPTGRGYQAISSGSREDQLSRYGGQDSRLAYFAQNFSDILPYADGDTFADLGCGTGQSIRFLVATYPSSVVIGADISADAVALVRECEPSENVQLTVGDMRDEEFLSRVLSPPIDHIVMSHVFALIFGQSMLKTRSLRQSFIDRAVARSRKSVIILDNFGKRGECNITIEQKQRALVTDDVMSYFDNHVEGRAFMVASARSQAIMFVHNK